MATEQLALPDWFGLRSDRQAALWLRTIEEHETVLRRLNDTHSDEFALLKQHRRTFQARRSRGFARGYSPKVTHAGWGAGAGRF